MTNQPSLTTASVARGAASSVGEGSSTNNQRRGLGSRRLTEAEEQHKRRRGVCFRCDERFFPGHVCKNKQLHVILLGEDEDEERKEPKDGEEEESEETTALQLNMSSVVGVTSKKSLKLWGTIKDKRVIVLVDSGASHNFLSHDLVRDLKLQPEATKGYTVEVGNGQRVKSQGVCQKNRIAATHPQGYTRFLFV